MATGSSIAIELEPLAPPTLDDLVRVTGVPLQKLDEPCSDEHLRDISSGLTQWRTVAPHLSLEEGDIEEIERDIKTESEKRLKALRKWKNKYSFKATYRVLTEALLKCRMAHPAEKVCRLLVPDPQELRDDSKPAHDKSAAASSTADSTSTSSYTSDVSVLEVLTPGSEDRAQNLYDEIHELEEKFENLEDEVEDSLTKAGTDLSRVKNRIVRLPVSLKYTHWYLTESTEETTAIENTTSIRALFTLLHNRYWNFLNCDLLCHIVDRFGNPNTKESKERYLGELRTFRMKTKVIDMVQLKRTPCTEFQKYVTLKLKMPKWKDRTLEELEQFRMKFAHECFIKNYGMQLHSVESGCIAVTFALPTSVDIAALCLRDLREFLKQHHVLRIIVNGSCILDNTTVPKDVDQSSPRKEEEQPQVLPQKATATPTMLVAEEIRIIGSKFVFLAERLPLDDIAPKMLERKLVTAREYAEYHIKKTAPENGEYLLECLKRRPAGSLKIFCDILREVQPATHLAELLELPKAHGMSLSKVSSETKEYQTGSKEDDQEDHIAMGHAQDTEEDVEQPLSPMSPPGFTLYDHLSDVQRLLDVESVYPYLISADCITAEDVEHLKTFHHSKHRMMVEVAYLISKKRGRGLREFMAALEQSSDHPGHHELLTILQQSIRRHREPGQHIEVVIEPPSATQDTGAGGESSTDQQHVLDPSPLKHTKKNVFTVPMLIQALRRLKRKLSPHSRRNLLIGTVVKATGGRTCCQVTCFLRILVVVIGFFIIVLGTGPTLILTGSIGLQGELTCNFTSDNTTETISLSSLAIYSVVSGVSYLLYMVVVVIGCCLLCCLLRDSVMFHDSVETQCHSNFVCCIFLFSGVFLISSVVMSGLTLTEFVSISNSYGDNVNDVCNPIIYYPPVIVLSCWWIALFFVILILTPVIVYA